MEGLFVMLLVIFLVGGIVSYRALRQHKCEVCGYLFNGGKKERVVKDGKALENCKKCGHGTIAGEIETNGTVIWWSGGHGVIDDEGNYMDIRSGFNSWHGVD